MHPNVSHVGFASERTVKRSKRFIIPGVPVPLRRPRMSGSHCWDSQKQQKLNASIILTHQLEEEGLFSAPVCVEVIFIFPIGIRVPKHKKEKMIDSPHIFKPDIDNCIKFILDCSNGIIWHDDCIVSVIFAKKIYGEARTIMTITEI
jgi:Holliday junction resolvase RusA-like endonuclease